MAGWQFEELAEKMKFIVVYPQAYKRHWNDGRGIKKYDSHRLNICDVCFINAIIDTLEKKYNIDTSRIFAAGISNGGIMAMRLACDPSSRIKKIASLAMLLTDTLTKICRMPHPRGAMFFIGTDDPLVPWQGGHIHFGKRKLGRVVSYDSTLIFFAHKNGCYERESTMLSGKIIKIYYEKCKHGGRTVMYILKGGGHTWPGAKSQLPSFIVGKTIRGLRATDTIVRFFLNEKY